MAVGINWQNITIMYIGKEYGHHIFPLLGFGRHIMYDNVTYCECWSL